jgi:hypothetical protein
VDKRAWASYFLGMVRRIAFALPLALVLGCGSAPPPPAAAPTASGETTPAATPPATAAAAAATPPPVAADAGKKSEGAPAPGKAQASDAKILTTITQADIMEAVNKNGEIFNRCYNLGAGSNKGWKAKVTVKATVSPVGAVNEVVIVTSTAKNPKVDACVSDGFKKLTFKLAPGSGASVFTFPLSFDGVEQVQ